MPLSIKQVRYFIATADSGQVSQAAMVLNVSQSAVTTAIKQLEENLGVSLFRRLASGVVLTAEGARFPSAVVVSAGMLGPADQQAVGRGGTLSLQCTMCHGTRGTSPAGTPHLAGQPAEATYKQLRDFKAGHRASAVMQPLVASLSDRDMRDLAHYYATLVRERPQPVPISYATPRLVRNGDPMRNVGACASCHSPNVARPGTPILDGMNESYVRSQLAAFRSGARANDINAQMRNAVRGLSVAEVDELARYYASR